MDAPWVIDQRGVRAASADGELAADRRREPVVQGGFDEQPAGVRKAGLGDLAQGRVWPEECSERTRPTRLAIASG